VDLVSDLLGPYFGPLAGFAGKAAAGIVAAIYLRRWAACLLVPPALISLWAAWYNIWGVGV